MRGSYLVSGCLLLVLLDGALTQTSDPKRCLKWITHRHTMICSLVTKIYAVEVSSIKEGRQQCELNPVCRSISCGKTVANAKIFRCVMYTFTTEELYALNYKREARGFTVSECVTEIQCTCCVIGDPFIAMGDGFVKKVTTNGLYRFVEADNKLDATCRVTSTVTTAVTDLLHPRRSRVTRITVNVGSRIIELDSTALTDELPLLKINGVPVPAPYTTLVDPDIVVTEYRGLISVSLPDCKVRVTFADTKHSKVCLDLESIRYLKSYNKQASMQLCGKCARNRKGKKNMAHDPENALIL